MDTTPLEFRKEFGRRIRRRRNILGKTQGAVARAIGMNRVHYSQLEGGRYQSIQLLHLAQLGEVLLTSLDYLLLRTDEDPGVIPPGLCPAEGDALSSAPLPVAITPREQ
jgi:transcriptional regulator with XRE-family HTH domain